MNIFDYPHIQEAIGNVANDLKYKNRACVIATMGIGKSAIASFTMLDYADKRIIFATPRHLLLEEMQGHLINMGYDLKDDFADLKFYTYAQLHAMIKKGIVPDFDLFVCDEFHAIAKKKQFESISKMFTYDEDKKYLGLSATPILQWDYEVVDTEDEETKRRVNMANTLYDGNVSFFYSLDEAFANGLFSIPVYDEFFVLSKNPREEAIEILKQRVGDNITEDQINDLVDYLNKEAGIVPILKKYLNLQNTKIMFYCRDFNDLLAKERLLKEEFPNLDIYKTSCRLSKADNKKNIANFRNNNFRDGNSKVLLSIRQMTEGFHTDGEMQIVFGNKTKAYRDFLQKFGRGCSLGNHEPVRILDLGGNLTRISSLDFLHFRNRLDGLEEKQKSIPNFAKVSFGGNIEDLNNYIESICQTAYVSERDKTDIYYDRIISNAGYLKDEREKYKDGTYLRGWHKEMLRIAKNELKLSKQNPEYKISSDNMYIIETLAYLEDYLRNVEVITEEDKRRIYLAKSLEFGNLLPKSEEYRFIDGMYMANWYNNQNKRIKEILKQLEKKDDYVLSEKDFELVKWFRDLHIGLKDVWLFNRLGSQWAEQESEKYQKWKVFSEAVDKNPKLLKTKKLCEGIEQFYCLEEYYAGVEERMTAYAGQSFAYSKLDLDSVKKHLVKKN